MTPPTDGTDPNPVTVAAGPREVAPDAAFKILGNETRLTILDTLWGPSDSGAMGFAELRKAVGMRDGSQFNYHLQRLVEGGFVDRTDDRYSIRQAGARVVSTVRTGYLTDHPEIAPFEVGGRCHACDGSLTARYTNEMFFIECAACERRHVFGWFPPNGLVGRTREAALLAFDRTKRAEKNLAAAGICPICNGQNERTVSRTRAEAPVDSPVLAAHHGTLWMWHVCPFCRAFVYVTPGEAVLDHPAVVGLYRDHGLDIREFRRWELPWTVDESRWELHATDPFRVAVTVDCEGDEQVLTLDEAFDIVDVR